MATIDLGLLGPCGIYCGKCDIHLAGKTGDREAQEKIANWIADNCNVECKPEQVHCGGCWGPLDDHWSEDCKVMLCARERGVKLCIDCDEYGDCDTLESFYQGGDYESARRTLERIKEVGLEAWVKETEATE